MSQQSGSGIGWWCGTCCGADEAERLEQATRQYVNRHRGRRGSLGIELTLMVVPPTNRQPAKVKSLSSLKPKKNPLTQHNRKHFLQVSKLQPAKISLGQPRKAELSAEMTTFIREDSLVHSRKDSFEAEKRSPRRSFLHQSSIFQQRLSTSKQESSRGSLLLVRNEQDDERCEHMRIKSLFHSRRLNSANRMSLTNVLNSISQEAENNEHGMNTPNELSRMIVPLTRQLTALPADRTLKKSSTGHTKANSTANTSACTYGPRTRQSSYAGISYKTSKKSLGDTSVKHLRL